MLDWIINKLGGFTSREYHEGTTEHFEKGYKVGTNNGKYLVNDEASKAKAETYKWRLRYHDLMDQYKIGDFGREADALRKMIHSAKGILPTPKLNLESDSIFDMERRCSVLRFRWEVDPHYVAIEHYHLNALDKDAIKYKLWNDFQVTVIPQMYADLESNIDKMELRV